MPKDIQQLRKQLIKKAKKQVQAKYSEKDVHIIRAVSVLADLDNAFNLLAENCIEWYSAHFPEMHSVVRDNEAFLKIVSELGERQAISGKKLSKLLGESQKASLVEEKAKKSMGSPLPKKALQEIKLLAQNALSLKEERKKLQQFIEVEMETLAPNFSEMAGPVLGARLLASASGLKQLAMMPSSTIQLLGAEKALFRHLRNKKSKGPKYGLIYGHPLVKKVPGKHKGKLARSLASKLVLAARADYFGSKKNLAKEMQKELEQRIKQLE
jgi:nucleolar protein 56